MNRRVIISIVLFLILIILGGSFWFVKNKKVENRNKEVSQEEVVAQEDNQGQQETDIEKIDTSNWHTYRNEEFGFEFKYPVDWIVEENRNPTTYLADRLLELRPKKIDEDNKNLIFYVIVSEIASDPKKWYQTKYENPGAIKDYRGETKELKINNLDAYYVVEDKDEYIQNIYIISKHKILIRSTFRSERDYSGNEDDFSYDEYLPHFKSLTYSIK